MYTHQRLLFSLAAAAWLMVPGLHGDLLYDMFASPSPVAMLQAPEMTEAEVLHIPTNRSVISLENADKKPEIFKNIDPTELDGPSLSSLGKECRFMSLPQLVAVLRAKKAKHLSAACYESISPRLFEYLPALLLNDILSERPDLMFKYTKNPSILKYINASLPQLPVFRGDPNTGKNGFLSNGNGDSLELSKSIWPTQFGHVNNLHNVDWGCLERIFAGDKCSDLTAEFFKSGDFPNITCFNYTAQFRPDVMASYRPGGSIASGHFDSSETKEHFENVVNIVVTKISEDCFDKMKNETQQYLIATYRGQLNQRIQRKHRLLGVDVSRPSSSLPKSLAANNLAVQTSACSALHVAHSVLVLSLLSALLCL